MNDVMEVLRAFFDFVGGVFAFLGGGDSQSQDAMVRRAIPLVAGVYLYSMGLRAWHQRGHRWTPQLTSLVTLPVTLFRCLSRSKQLSRWLLRQSLRFIPADQRDRFYLEWLANLEQLEQEGLPTLGEAIQILHAGAKIGSRRRMELAGTHTNRQARRLGPVLVGLLTFLGSFLIALSSLLVATSSPTEPQLGTALVGSILLGVVAGDQARKAKSEDREA